LLTNVGGANVTAGPAACAADASASTAAKPANPAQKRLIADPPAGQSSLCGAEAYACCVIIGPMEDPMVVSRNVSVPLSEIELRVSRSSGPGGQHANVTASRVEAIFDVAGSPSLSEEQRKRVMARVGPRLTAVAQDTRSQARNRELALERLRARLASALSVPRTRHATRPSKASRTERLESKRRRSDVKRARRRPGADD
jgi:ribosome-associated protein